MCSSAITFFFSPRIVGFFFPDYVIPLDTVSFEIMLEKLLLGLEHFFELLNLFASHFNLFVCLS